MSSFTDCASVIGLPDSFELAINRKKNSDVTTYQHEVIVNLFNVVLFILLRLVTGLSFMPISLLFLEYDNFPLYGIDQKYGNREYLCLSFARYPETGWS